MFGRAAITLGIGPHSSLCMKYLSNRWTDLRQIQREDVFDPLLGQVWMSRSKVKVITDKNGVFGRYLWHIRTENMFGPRSDEFEG